MNSRKNEANAQKDAKETGKMELIQEAVLRNIVGGEGCCSNPPNPGHLDPSPDPCVCELAPTQGGQQLTKPPRVRLSLRAG